MLAQPVQGPDVRLVCGAKRRRVLRPHVGPVEGCGCLSAAGGMVRHLERPDRERFLQVGRRLHTDRRRELLGTDRLVAPASLLLLPLPDGELLLMRQVEERTRIALHALDERRIHPVARDQEETDTLAGAADLVRDALPVSAAAHEIGAEVDQGNFREGAGRHGSSSRRASSLPPHVPSRPCCQGATRGRRGGHRNTTQPSPDFSPLSRPASGPARRRYRSRSRRSG